MCTRDHPVFVSLSAWLASLRMIHDVGNSEVSHFFAAEEYHTMAHRLDTLVRQGHLGCVHPVAAVNNVWWASEGRRRRE